MKIPTPLELAIYDIMRGNLGFHTSGGPGHICKCCGRFTGAHESDITIHHTETCILRPIVPLFVVRKGEVEGDDEFENLI